MPFSIRELSKKDWPHIEALFGERGACGGCWCMWWRVPQGGKLWDQTKGETARRQMRKLVETGKALGVLAFEGTNPVGWCTFGPREDFPRLERTKAYANADGAKVWSIPCFFIHPKHRGQGLSRSLLAAAVAAARRRGARTLEGYPVPLGEDGKPLPAAFSWTGPLPVFEGQGFRVIRRLAASKPLVRRNLAGKR